MPSPTNARMLLCPHADCEMETLHQSGKVVRAPAVTKRERDDHRARVLANRHGFRIAHKVEKQFLRVEFVEECLQQSGRPFQPVAAFRNLPQCFDAGVLAPPAQIIL
jgi:hypothetical protein